jgi:long-chain acyl-CoA synthetase
MTQRPFAWEKSYPPGVRWDVTIKPSTLVAMLAQTLAANGHRPAIDFRERKLSYDELGREIDLAAATLMRHGIRPGSPVALYLPNVPWHPIAFFGTLKAGARAVHLSPLDAERTLRHKLSDSGARTLVTTNLAPLLPMALKLLDADLVDLILVGDDARWGLSPAPALAIPQRASVRPIDERGEPPAAWPQVAPSDIAMLQYTGGTTGQPKGAMLTHANLTAALQIYDAWYGGQGFVRRGGERIICVLPLFHIYALTVILLKQLSNGNEILLRTRFDVETTLADIEQKRATSFPGVPTMWIALANHPGIESRDFSSLELCSSGGAPLPLEVQQRFQRLTGRRLGGGWGMTETCPAGTHVPILSATKPGTIGLPLPGIEMDVVALDDPACVLPPGETGEIRIKGPNVTSGYWGRPEESAAAFVDGHFLTGDVGYMDADGFFFLVDRKKDLIVSGGFNVYPQMIEQAIYEHPGVDEAIVIGVPDAYRGEAAKAYIKLRAGVAPFTLDELRAFLADKLGRHEMPAALEFRDSLPRTPVGKLSRLELRNEARGENDKKPPGGKPA